MAKKKKEKITYVDDGSSVADMSALPRRLPKRDPHKPRTSMKEARATYWAAVKMMFGPMLVVVCGLLILYMILYLVFFLMA